MNKDSAWLSFSCRRNEFDEVECSEHEWYTELRPWGYHNLTDYLTGRQAPKHRKHIRLCMYFSIRFALSFFIPVVTWAYVSRVKAAV